jgi:hypothetical protein
VTPAEFGNHACAGRSNLRQEYGAPVAGAPWRSRCPSCVLHAIFLRVLHAIFLLFVVDHAVIFGMKLSLERGAMMVVVVDDVDGLTAAAAGFNGPGLATAQPARAKDALRRRLAGGTRAAPILPAR